ncbi:MAG: TIGR03862 family flavoprotein [Crocinitomix sp.]|nr:TIGR03862 family flavoprotein [Crocinitomix sp.]
MSKPVVALFGGGPACLIAAFFLADQCEVHLYEKGKSLGRKFLVAGKGGFNLTNSATGDSLEEAYSYHPNLAKALNEFDSTATRAWLKNLGIETFVGSSGRVFPEKEIKPAFVLTKIKEALVKKGVQVHLNHEFVGFNEEQIPLITSNNETKKVVANHCIFGLGGGSWSKTGSNSKWLTYFAALGIKTIPFQASNCGIELTWDPIFSEKFNGTPLKNIAIKVDKDWRKGEILVTSYGFEGNAIYPSVPEIRQQLMKGQNVEIHIDLKPHNSLDELLIKAAQNGLKSADYSKVFKVERGAIELVKSILTKSEFTDPTCFAKTLKMATFKVNSLRPLDEAISTVGGISMEEVTTAFASLKFPQFSFVGEMLDWDAPTGGYLLQGCFTTGYVAANRIIDQFNN